MSFLSNKANAKSGKQGGNSSEGTDGVVRAMDTSTQQNAALPARQSVRVDAALSGSGLPRDNTQRNMFGDNSAIFGGQFTQVETVNNNINNNRTDPFELLQRRVAPSAFHNSAQRVDPPRCHPDTRVAILDSIYSWIIHSKNREEWLLWLNGAAGAGKSAIIQSIAERCVLEAITIASFFFFRGDTTRNTTAPLIATLVYQLIQVIPETSEDILLTIERNPLVFDQSLDIQLQLLLIQPLLRLPKHLFRVLIVLIDGLDECNDRARQSSLIKSFGTVSRGRNSPIIFVISSRREPQIEAAFVDRHVSKLLRTFELDNSDLEKMSNDIRRFLADKFVDIKETHLRRHLLPSDWPQESAVKEIITKSSGQFIYSSVVINYVSSPRGNPTHLLDIVRGIRLRNPTSQNPFTNLDALYQHIFSQVEMLDIVLDILAHILITKTSDISHIEGAFLLESGELEVYFANLAAVIECRHGLIDILHPSLPDFLLDKTRSERHHINVEECTLKLLCMFLNRVPPTLDPLSQAYDLHILRSQEHQRLRAIWQLLDRGVKPSDRLRSSFMNFSIELYQGTYSMDIVIGILKYLKQLDFNDQLQAYQHVLDLFAAELAKYWPSLSHTHTGKVREFPDLLASIRQICPEL